MLDILNYLYISVFGLMLSGSALLFRGKKSKKKHWLWSLLVTAGIIASGAHGLNQINVVEVTTNVYLALFIISTLSVAQFDNWNSIGQVTFSFALQSAIGFIAYSIFVTLNSGLGPLSLSFSLLLIGFIVASLTLMLAQTFEMIDVICRIHWRRVFEPTVCTDYFPKVSLHVPAYNEPPEMVIETLNALAKLDYPNYEVLMVDNNTSDKKLWQPVEAHCKKLGFKFIHLENWPGYKSGALNYAIGQVHPDTEIIGIIDADYIVEANYLEELVNFFESDNVAFVQTPQDYRDFEASDKYAQACYHSYQYFFKMSMASRNERNGIIFTGTMGLIRRRVLEEVGGWDEWCITEDAEIALKILDRGYESIYVDKTYGRGLMPLNFEGLKKQRFRWAFGGMQVLRLHWKKLLPFTSVFHKKGRLSTSQKLDYWSGGLQWLNDPLAFVFTAILLVSTSSFVISNSVFLQPMAGATLYIPFVFIVFGMSKSLWALRIRLRCGFGEAYRAFVVLLSLTWVVTVACLLGLTKKQGVFLRTPKQDTSNNLLSSFVVVYKEVGISLLCIVAVITIALTKSLTPTSILLSGLLLWQSFIYGSAFIVNRWSNVSLKLNHIPYQLKTTRTSGHRIRVMVSDTRVAVFATFALAMTGFYFYTAIQIAPEKEVAYRINRLQVSYIPHALINSSPEDFVKAQIFLEEQSSLFGDVEKALSLWHHDGVIIDANYTLANKNDDKTWRGINEVRKRYIDEFKLRNYKNLRHVNIKTVIDGNKAVVVNDLVASYAEGDGYKKVYLAEGDRWVLKKYGGNWKIDSLIVNRSSAGSKRTKIAEYQLLDISTVANDSQ